MALHARSGVGEYSIVDPERRTVIVNALDGRDYRAVEPNAQGWVASRVFPGLLVDPAEVFAGLD
jgi:Uma2 family endonuclease